MAKDEVSDDMIVGLTLGWKLIEKKDNWLGLIDNQIYGFIDKRFEAKFLVSIVGKIYRKVYIMSLWFTY